MLKSGHGEAASMRVDIELGDLEALLGGRVSVVAPLPERCDGSGPACFPPRVSALVPARGGDYSMSSGDLKRHTRA